MLVGFACLLVGFALFVCFVDALLVCFCCLVGGNLLVLDYLLRLSHQGLV